MKYVYEIPDDKVSELDEAFAEGYDYDITVTDEKGDRITNPETKDTHTKRKIQEFIEEIYKSYKVKIAISETRIANKDVTLGVKIL